MRFSIWRVVSIAMMPVLALFVGLSAVSPFDLPIDWTVVGAVIASAAVAAYLGGRYATDGR